MSTLHIRQLTPDNRYWRIDWFGEFSYPPGQRRSQPSVQVAISPLLCNPEDYTALLSTTATSHNNQRLAWLPIGILGAVRIGDIWKDGQCVLSPSYQTERFEKLDIRRETTNFVKSGMTLDGAYLLTVSAHPWHIQCTMSFCLKVSLANEKRLIIPCIELIRFYFGSSSRLLNLLFTKQISKDDFYKNMQLAETTGHLHLKLASGLSGMSAADIGRLSLNQDAWRAARLIFDRCMAASVQREPIYPYTGFPFIGKTDLIVSGKWLPHGGKPDETFVVYSLRSCSHPFPFDSLSYESSDDRKVSLPKNRTENSQGNQSSTFIKKSVKPESQTLADTDPGKSRSNKEFWETGSPRFPDLINKRIWRESYDTADPPVILFSKEVCTQTEKVSVGNGVSSNGDTREIDIGQGHNYEQIQDIDLKKHKFVADGVKLALRQTKSVFQITEAVLITLPGYSHPVISLPHLVDENGEIHLVSFHTDGRGNTRCRRGCFVDLRKNDGNHRRAFIVEREDTENKVRVITVRDFDLAVAMGMLVKEYLHHNHETGIDKFRKR